MFLWFVSSICPADLSLSSTGVPGSNREEGGGGGDIADTPQVWGDDEEGGGEESKTRQRDSEDWSEDWSEQRCGLCGDSEDVLEAMSLLRVSVRVHG